jgi:hypothetical protein
MKKSLLFIGLSLMFISLTAKAQSDIVGAYTGTVTVDYAQGSTIPNVEIFLTAETGGTYQFSESLNFSYGEMKIGDLIVPGVTATENNGIILFNKYDGAATGPTVVIPIYGALPTRIYLRSGSRISAEGKLIFDLGVVGVHPVLNELTITEVHFEGTKVASGFDVVSASENAVILNTVVDNSLTALVKGEYKIYSTNGSVLQSGNVQANEINVSALKTGIYFINIDGKTAKFIKL